MVISSSEVGKCTHQVLGINVRSALDNNEDEDDVGANPDADHTEEGTSKEGQGQGGPVAPQNHPQTRHLPHPDRHAQHLCRRRQERVSLSCSAQTITRG